LRTIALLYLLSSGPAGADHFGPACLCKKFAESGFVAVTITYRLVPKHPFPAAVHDCKAAVRWIRANAAKYNIDPAKIGFTGGSAGGHLAQFLGVTANVPEFEGTEDKYVAHEQAVWLVESSYNF